MSHCSASVQQKPEMYTAPTRFLNICKNSSLSQLAKIVHVLHKSLIVESLFSEGFKIDHMYPHIVQWSVCACTVLKTPLHGQFAWGAGSFGGSWTRGETLW